jgi:hypothetical protein
VNYSVIDVFSTVFMRELLFSSTLFFSFAYFICWSFLIFPFFSFACPKEKKQKKKALLVPTLRGTKASSTLLAWGMPMLRTQGWVLINVGFSIIGCCCNLLFFCCLPQAGKWLAPAFYNL